MLAADDFSLILQKIEKICDICVVAKYVVYLEYIETFERTGSNCVCIFGSKVALDNIMKNKEKLKKELVAKIKLTDKRAYIYFNDVKSLVTWLKLESN